MDRIWVAALAATTLLLAHGCGDSKSSPADAGTIVPDSGPLPDETDTSAWKTERTARTAELESFLTAQSEGWEAFRNAPVGNSGVPVLFFRLLPELYPALWGPPEENFARIGLSKDPYDANRPFPLGIGFIGTDPAIPTPAGPIKINIVQPTCAACHIGKVTVDGKTQYVAAAPNNQFYAYTRALAGTVLSPTFTSTALLGAINAKPAGFFYNDPAMAQQEQLERAILNTSTVARDIVRGLKAFVAATVQRQFATLGTYTYGPANNPPDPSIPEFGYVDAIGLSSAIVVDPTMLTPAQVAAAMPPKPALTDMMVVWRQSARPNSGWDGSLPSLVHRNVAAALSVVQNPAFVNLAGILKITPFTQGLPATPYPFDVFSAKAIRGKLLFQANCEGCHHDNNDEIYPWVQTRTDPNRTMVWTAYNAPRIRALLRAACTDPLCAHADGTPLSDLEIIRPSYGYPALPLAGIWATAPYLHNGSVPTLRSLLTGVRPATFQRGSQDYDQADVGFVWDKPGPGTATYDTTKSGNSNAGHDTPQFLGTINWKAEPAKTDDLLEYLKTL